MRSATTVLFIGSEAVEQGAVGVLLEGVDVLPCVSQGAAPIGPEMVVTGGRRET
jgi:small ligand-binding sensory domain FIST